MLNVDEPQFAAADVAEIIGEAEPTVRRWHHSGFAGFFGRKLDYAVRYSLRDMAGFAVARDLVRLNFPPMLAARIGATVTYANLEPGDVLRGHPRDLALIAPPHGSGIRMDRTAWRVPEKSEATIEIPVGRIFHDIVARAGRRVTEER